MAVKVRKADAVKVLAAVKKAFAGALPANDPDNLYGPKLVKDWDWTGSGPAPYAIIWEGGPYDWAVYFPYGGIDPEFGSKIADVSSEVPKDVFCEAVTGWALGLYDGRW